MFRKAVLLPASARVTVPATHRSAMMHSGPVLGRPTGQHMAADGEELKSEHDKHMKSGHKEWNEKLATHSEAGIRAEKDSRSAAAMQKDSVKDSSANRRN